MAALSRVVHHCECFTGFEAVVVDGGGVDIMDEPGPAKLGRVAPPEALESMVHDPCRAHGSPDVIFDVRALEIDPKEGVKSAHMIHVQMGQEQMRNRLDFAVRNTGQRVRPTVEQHARAASAAIGDEQQRVVVGWDTENTDV
jgi:hypothetical protein